MFWMFGATFCSLMEQVRITCTFLSSQTLYISVTAFLDEMFFNREDERNICFRNVGACYVTRRDNPEHLRLTLTRTVTRFSNVSHTHTHTHTHTYIYIYIYTSVTDTVTFTLQFKWTTCGAREVLFLPFAFLTGVIGRATANRQYCRAACLDVSQTFDKV